MTVLSRNEFVKVWEPMQIDPDDMSEPIWAYEAHRGVKSQYFVCSRSIYTVTKDIQEYWRWCDDCLINEAMCYSSNYSKDEEWWGFTNKDDLILWILKWGCK